MDYKYYKSHIYIHIYIHIYVTICILYSSWSRFQDPKSRVTRTTGHIQVSGNHWGYARPVFIHVIRTFTTHTLHVRHMFGLPKFCRNFEPGCFFIWLKAADRTPKKHEVIPKWHWWRRPQIYWTTGGWVWDKSGDFEVVRWTVNTKTRQSPPANTPASIEVLQRQTVHNGTINIAGRWPLQPSAEDVL